MKYVCPDEIADMFDKDEQQRRIGREKAIEWADTLDLEIGDQVWMPEVGWCEKSW